MKSLPALLLFCLATIAVKDNAVSAADYPSASLSDIRTVDGFLAVCGLSDSQASKFTMERIKHAPEFNVNKVFEEKLHEQTLCVSYSIGLYDGWKEGHDDGVLTAHLPDGVVPFPDIQPTLKLMSAKELGSIKTQMHSDVPCDPEKQTAGDIRDALVSYVHHLSELKFHLGK